MVFFDKDGKEKEILHQNVIKEIRIKLVELFESLENHNYEHIGEKEL